MVDDTITSTQVKISRPLPAANQKAAGFLAFRSRTQQLNKRARASGSAGASGSATAPPIDAVRPRQKPQGIGQAINNNSPAKVLNRHDPDSQANDSHSHDSPVYESRGGKKRKLDEIEVIELESDEDTVEVLNPKELRNTGTLNKACTLVRAALAKAEEGEKERLRVETCLRQQIASLEGKLQQEKKDHDDSKQHIRDLERGLLAAKISSLELTNSLIRVMPAQLIKHPDDGRDKE